MSLDSASIPAAKCSSTTPINHFFGPDGILLGVTYPKIICELKNFLNAGSFINCQESIDSKPPGKAV